MAPVTQRRLNRGQSSSVEFRLGLYVAGGTLDAVSWFKHISRSVGIYLGIMLIFWITDTGVSYWWVNVNTIWKGNLFHNITRLHNGVQEGTGDCSHDSDALN